MLASSRSTGGIGTCARRSVAAALAARDVQDLVHADAADVARGHQFVVLGDDQHPGVLQRIGHLRHGDARQPELVGDAVHRPAPPAGDVRAAEQVHQPQRQLLRVDAREAQLLQPEAQVRRVLHVEGQLRAGEHDQPAEVGPQQRRHDEREAGIDDGQARGIDHQRGEHLAGRRPQHAADQGAGERGAPVHARVGNHHVQHGEERGDHRVGSQHRARCRAGAA